MKNFTCVGIITDAYHLRGLVKIKTFTSKPENICLLKCQDEFGNVMEISKKPGRTNIFAINNVTDRTTAERIVGTKIYVDRRDLPPTESDDEFYIDDLVDVPVFDTNNTHVGRVRGCFNFGAGDILEIAFMNEKEEMFLFTKENFLEASKEKIVIAQNILS
jgi:16S rRNA processing protein RimM